VSLELVFVFICLLISFCFSGAETALTSLGRLEIQNALANGGPRAKLIQYWVREPNRLLITILVGNNLANIASSSVFTVWATKHLSNHLSLAVVCLTIVFIIFAEILPKMMARALSLRVAPYAVRFLKFTSFVLAPVIFLMQKVTTGIVFLSGMPGRQARVPVTEEMVSHTIEMATKEGGLDRATGEVLSNMIEFSDRLAVHVMTTRNHLSAISVSWNWDQVLRYVAMDGHSRYPVYRKSLDDIVGVILVKDLLREFQKAGSGSWTGKVRRPYYVSELAPLGMILRDMKKWGTHLALVRNETGLLTGLLTLEDLLEEIVGEIRDEHDDPSEGGSEHLGGPRIVSGDISIVDLNDRFDLALPIDASYGTLNGYLLSRAGGQIPPPGTLIIDDQVSFRVQSISDQGVVTVELIENAMSLAEQED
jgi:putative hemolysin